jgi:serine/threonine-protein kinase RsbW
MPLEPYRRDMRIANETKNLSLVRQAVNDILERTTFSMTDRTKIVLAVDEAVANVVEHAYQGGRGDIDLVFALDQERLEIVLRDNGTKFNPQQIATPDIHDHIKRGLKGGLGMFLMRKIMDEVRYSSDSSYVNELIMVKYCPPEGSGLHQGAGKGA